MDNYKFFGKICYIHRQMKRENSCLFSEYGLTPVRFHALIMIACAEREGRKICQKDIEKEVNLRPSSISTLLSGLERDGFILRAVSGEDARAKHIMLTEKSRQLCELDRAQMDECDNIIADALEEDEKKEFNRLLDKIIDKTERR